MSINSLGFAGSLLVRDRRELNELREAGPIRALESVVEPAAGSGPAKEAP